MKRKMSNHKWICLSMANLSIHLLDGLVTYINTPDLKMEANILVSRFGYGWGALFTANLIGFLFIILITWNFCRYEHVRIPSKGWFDYSMRLFYGDDYKPYWCLYKISRNWRSKLAALSYAIYWGLTVGAVVPVIGWLLHMLGITPAWWRSMLFSSIVGIAVGYGGLVKWLRDGYRESMAPESGTAMEQEERGNR